MLIDDNQDYVEKVIDGISTLVASNDNSFENLCKIDTSLNILFSSLIKKNFLKVFI